MEKQLPMSFEEFDTIINELQRENRYMDECSAVGFDGLIDSIPSYDIVVKLLSMLFNDDDNWLSWWVYDAEFGLKNFEAFDENGETIPELDTIEGIYDLLIHNYYEE